MLKAIAKLFRAAARPQDLAARYGGEEICLVLPATPRSIAAAVAESIRAAVAARPIPVAPRPTPTGVAPTAAASPVTELTVTVSVGVATYEPGCPLREPAHLLKAADLAVYAAKKVRPQLRPRLHLARGDGAARQGRVRPPKGRGWVGMFGRRSACPP